MHVGPVSSLGSSLKKHFVCIQGALAPDAQPTFKPKHGFSSRQHQGSFHKNEGMMQYVYSASSTQATLLRIVLGNYYTSEHHVVLTSATLMQLSLVTQATEKVLDLCLCTSKIQKWLETVNFGNLTTFGLYFISTCYCLWTIFKVDNIRLRLDLYHGFFKS